MTARHRISDRNVLVIGTWNFDIVWNLSIVIWDFSVVSGKSNRFYLNQLELTLNYGQYLYLENMNVGSRGD